MKLLTKVFILSAFLVSTTIANENIVDSIGINIGSSNSSYSLTNNIDVSTPDESLTSIKLYTKFNPFTDLCKKYNMKPSVSYTASQNDELKHQYLLLGINKYYKLEDNYQLYTGLDLGYGELEWKDSPIKGSDNNNYTATNPMIGINGGLNYFIDNSFYIDINVEYLYHGYETKLKPTYNTRGSFKHDDTFNISLGFGWKII